MPGENDIFERQTRVSSIYVTSLVLFTKEFQTQITWHLILGYGESIALLSL